MRFLLDSFEICYEADTYLAKMLSTQAEELRRRVALVRRATAWPFILPETAWPFPGLAEPLDWTAMMNG